jgi:hypothetical protein
MFLDILKKLVSPKVEFKAVQVYPYLFQSSKISTAEDVAKICDMGIRVVIDLEGGLDVPMTFLKSYLWWPILDIPFLPDRSLLECVGYFGWGALIGGQRVLVHCRQGLNRSGLVCAKIMSRFNIKGPQILATIREKVPGALFNPVFAEYVRGL